MDDNRSMNGFWTTIRELSSELNIKPETSRKWQTKRSVPAKWHYELLSAATRKDMQLDWDELRNPPSLLKGKQQ